jgi:hypothetical protein
MTKGSAYIKLVEWSEEDQCFVGSIPGFLGPCCHGFSTTDSVVAQIACSIVTERVEAIHLCTHTDRRAS